MSVLNKMLRDLEQRQSKPQPPAYTAPAQSERPLWLNLLLLLSGALLCFAVYAILTRDNVAPVVVASQSSLQLSADNALPASPPERVETNTPPVQSVTVIAQAATAQAKDNLADTTSARADLTAATTAMQESAVSAPSDGGDAATNTKTAAAMADKAGLALLGTNDIAAETAAVVMAAKPAPVASVAPESLRIEKQALSPQQRAQRLQQQALQAAAGGELMQALQYWQQLQQLTPQQAQVYLAQARLWQQLSQPLQAEQVLQQARAQQVQDADIQLLLARLAAARGEWQQVAQLLAADFPLAQYPDYYGLKATALQQSGEQAQALHWFSQLIVLQPQQARWWLGAAVALDAQGQRQQAHLHYQQALQWGDTLSPDSRNYIQQRIIATE